MFSTLPPATWTFIVKRVFVPTGNKTRSGKPEKIPVILAKVLLRDPMRIGGSGEYQITRCTRSGWIRYVVTEKPRTAELRWGLDGIPRTVYSVGEKYTQRVDSFDREDLYRFLDPIVGRVGANAILNKLDP